MISYAFRQSNFQRIIDRSPGEFTVYRRRNDPDETQVIVSFTGRLLEVGGSGYRILNLASGQPGEAPYGRSAWCIFAPVDTATVAQGDEVKYVSPTGITRWFDIAIAKQRDEGWHIMCDERQ